MVELACALISKCSAKADAKSSGARSTSNSNTDRSTPAQTQRKDSLRKDDSGRQQQQQRKGSTAGGSTVRAAAAAAEGRAEADGEQAAADLHVCNFLLPLLDWAMHSVRYPQLSRWHRLLAWHVARGCAEALLATLPRPAEQKLSSAASGSAELQVVAGQPIALLASRQQHLTGVEGALKHIIWRCVLGVLPPLGP